MTEDVLNRILAERDKAHQAEIARLEAEHKARSLEARLTAIEQKLKEADEKENSGIAGLGIGLPELLQAYAMYQQTQTPTK